MPNLQAWGKAELQKAAPEGKEASAAAAQSPNVVLAGTNEAEDAAAAATDGILAMPAKAFPERSMPNPRAAAARVLTAQQGPEVGQINAEPKQKPTKVRDGQFVCFSFSESHATNDVAFT